MNELFDLVLQKTNDPDHQGYLENVELVLYGTSQAPVQMLRAPRIYPQQYKRKSEFPEARPEVQPAERLQAILNDLKDWI
jgi:hypothetical protein